MDVESRQRAHGGRRGGELSPARLLVLAAIFAAGNAWVVHHVGVDVLAFAGVNTLLLLASGGAAWLTTREQGEARRQGRAVLAAASSTPVLLAAALLLVIVSAFVSSVRVIASDVREPATVRLLAPGDAREEGKRLAEAGSVRFLRATTPFGRPLSLHVEGYLPQPIDLYPFRGATIRTSSLRTMPSALLRVPVELTGHLTGGSMVVTASGREPLTVALDRGQGGVLLGRAAIPAQVIDDWRSELRALVVGGAGTDAPSSAELDAVRERHLRAWRNPVRRTVAVDLRPGTRLVAVLCSRGEVAAGRVEFEVDERPFQDVVLERTSHEEINHEQDDVCRARP
jgi:microcompartment protein CcmK/EutM